MSSNMTLYQYNAKKVTYRAFESSRRYDEIISYNKNSAPLSLVRYGKNNTNQYTVIDALSYRYNGNQLVNVSDTCTHSLLYSNSFEFVNDNEGLSETEYTYDGNGNMTSDLNKGISSITYDKLNNPSRISYSNGKMMDYDYSADGRKLSTTYVSVLSPLNPPIFPIIHSSDNILEQPSLPSAHVSQDSLESTASVVSSLSPLASTIMSHNAYNIRSISTTEYFGNYIFENGYLSTILLDDGYISFSVPNNSYILLPFDVPYTAPTFHFYLKDHLGSNRVVLSESGSVEQTNHYYPYGGMIGDLSTNQWKHPYKYNGKEYETMHGLNTYDYGARQYDPARITWDRMDQLCEEKPWNNPYVFCSANPINRIDLDGNDDYSINKNGTFTLIQRNQSLTDKIISTSNNSIEVSRSFMQSHVNLTINVRGSQSIDENTVFKADVDMYNICNGKGATQIYEFLKNNTDVEWSKTDIGNNNENISVISTTHNDGNEAGQGVIVSLITEETRVPELSNMSKYNTIFNASHTHTQNNLTVSSGDVKIATKIQNKFPQAKLTIYDGTGYYEFNNTSEPGLLPELICIGNKIKR